MEFKTSLKHIRLYIKQKQNKNQAGSKPKGCSKKQRLTSITLAMKRDSVYLWVTLKMLIAAMYPLGQVLEGILMCSETGQQRDGSL